MRSRNGVQSLKNLRSNITLRPETNRDLKIDYSLHAFRVQFKTANQIETWQQHYFENAYLNHTLAITLNETEAK